jgi:hypothetical protein
MYIFRVLAYWIYDHEDICVYVFFLFYKRICTLTSLGVLAYWIYDHEDWVPLNIPLSIISFGVFFPLAFVIGFNPKPKPYLNPKPKPYLNHNEILNSKS